MNRDVRGVFTCLIVLLSFIFSPFAMSASRWDNPLPQGNILADVAWNGSRYVAIGNVGTILESVDGMQWNRVASGTKTWLQAVRWTGTQFIAVGNSGTVLTSADGLLWTRQASGSTSYLYGVEHAGNLTVVVGSTGTVLTSNDGVVWTTRNAGVGVRDWLNDVAWNGQEFVAVGENGAIVASTDGVNWSRRVSPVRTDNADGTVSGPSLEGIAWSPELGRWAVVSEIGQGSAGSAAYVLTSSDGLLWTAQVADSRALHAVIWNSIEQRFVAVGTYGRVLTSADGLAWNTANDTGWPESLESVAFGAAGYVTVGEHGIVLSTADPTGAWTRRSTGDLTALSAAAFQGGGYAVVGDGIVLRSANAALGQPVAITQAQGQALPALRGVASGPEGYVAVGRGGAILHSADGSAWVFDANSGNDLNDVMRTPAGAWFAVGAAGTIRSDSGQGWNTLRSGDESLNAIAADADGLIAVGARNTVGVLLASVNGDSWTERSVADVAFLGVATGNGRRVAVGSGGTFATFAGGTWVDGNVGTVYALNHVAWDGHRFIAVGDQGMTFTSGDGIHWAQQTVTGNNLAGVATSADGFLAVGEGGTVVSTSCPCATDDTASTPVNVAVSIAVLANDLGDGLVVRAHDARSTRGGSIAVNADGTLTYTPAADFSGTDVFSYTLGSSTDADAADTANVTVTVGAAGGGGSSGGTDGGTDNGTGVGTDGGTDNGTGVGTDGGSSGGVSGGSGGGGGGSAASLLGLLLLAGGRTWHRRSRA